jgi:hypothetical protein
MRILKTREVYEPDTITHAPLEIGAGPQCEARFTHTAGPDQREEAITRECRFDVRKQAPPAHEAR